MTTTQEYNFAELAPKVKTAMRKAFPEDTIIVKEGYRGRIHLKVVSERFNGMSENDKHDYIWDVLRAETDTEAQEAISVAIAYSTDEL